MENERAMIDFATTKAGKLLDKCQRAITRLAHSMENQRCSDERYKKYVAAEAAAINALIAEIERLQACEIALESISLAASEKKYGK